MLFKSTLKGHPIRHQGCSGRASFEDLDQDFQGSDAFAGAQQETLTVPTMARLEAKYCTRRYQKGPGSFRCHIGPAPVGLASPDAIQKADRVCCFRPVFFSSRWFYQENPQHFPPWAPFQVAERFGAPAGHRVTEWWATARGELFAATRWKEHVCLRLEKP